MPPQILATQSVAKSAHPASLRMTAKGGRIGVVALAAVLRPAHPASLAMLRIARMTVPTGMLVAWVVLVSAVQGAPMLATPAYENLSPYASVPPYFENRLIYYNGFSQPDGKPEIDKTGAQQVWPIKTAAGGFLGKGLVITGANQALHLRGDVFSPERPVAFSWWWALSQDLTIDGGFDLFLLQGRGIISQFSRGKGEWCALQKPAGVVQVYYFPDIGNVNGIYDFDYMAHLDLRKGVWHHGAMVITGGSLVEAYTDGNLVFSTRTRGRPFGPEDNLHDLVIGSGYGYPMMVDEVMAFNRAITGDEIKAYITATRQMRDAGYE
jgi:hypothetical protein